MRVSVFLINTRFPWPVNMCEASVWYIDAINVSICTWYVSLWWAWYYMHVPLFGVDWVGRALCLDLLTENGIVDLAHRSTPPLRWSRRGGGGGMGGSCCKVKVFRLFVKEWWEQRKVHKFATFTSPANCPQHSERRWPTGRQLFISKSPFPPKWCPLRVAGGTRRKWALTSPWKLWSIDSSDVSATSLAPVSEIFLHNIPISFNVVSIVHEIFYAVLTSMKRTAHL